MRCKDQIVSEAYRDFIVSLPARELFSRPEIQDCYVDGGFFYRIYYVKDTENFPSELTQFRYSEIPKCYTLLGDALWQAGIIQVQNIPALELMGSNVMIGFVDTGIDYRKECFQNLDGSTRIAAIWDQTIATGNPPEGLEYGSEYSSEMINQALESDDPLSIVPSVDENGHGTTVVQYAAGGVQEEGQMPGAAPEATIAVVKLKQAKQYLREYYLIDEAEDCFQENDIMLAVKYLNQLAEKLNLPLVICVALGTNQGGHNGTSPLSGILELYANQQKRGVVIGGGGEAVERHHFLGKLNNINEKKSVEVKVEADSPGFCMELWTDIPNIMAVSILSPTGQRIEKIQVQNGKTSTFRFLLEGTEISVSYYLLTEEEGSELIFFRVVNPATGIWRFDIEPEMIADGIFHLWLPVKEFLKTEVVFLESNPDNTLTEPANIISGVTCGFYNGEDNSIAISSGRGYTREGRIKPDLVAPGSNSSMATAIAAGAVALLFEWMDMSSSQARSLLVLGARRREGEDYPNQIWGYGQMDLYRTFESIRNL